MSHAMVYVITENEPTNEILHETLLPWHEYECTEYKEYLEEIDNTEEVTKGWNELTDESKAEYNNNIIKYCTEYYGYDASYVNNELKFTHLTNPNARWDWWQIGGRFNGGMINNNGKEENVLQKKDVNFEIRKKEYEKTYSDLWDKVMDVIDGREIPDWTALMNKYDIEKAREIYNSNEVVMDLNSKRSNSFYIDAQDFINKTKEEYIDSHSYTIPFALVYDKTWYEIGELGWFATVSNEKTIDDWAIEFYSVWNNIPNDYWVTLIDYHI